jgi:hypothetical protein
MSDHSRDIETQFIKCKSGTDHDGARADFLFEHFTWNGKTCDTIGRRGAIEE